MARPNDADSRETMEKILTAASELLTEAGDDGPPSLRAVAGAAGVSVGTIQYYFESREELFEACLDAYYERLAALARSFMDSDQTATDPGAMIEMAARALFQWAQNERPLLKLRRAMNASRGELHPRRQRDFLGGFIDEAAKALSPHTDVSELEVKISMQMLATAVFRFALMSDSEVEWLTGLDPEAGRTTLETFLAGAGRRLVRPGDGQAPILPVK